MGIDLETITNPRFRALLDQAEHRAARIQAPNHFLRIRPLNLAGGRRGRIGRTPERKIHDLIVAFCDRNRIVAIHADPTRKSTIRIGYPDLFCCRQARVIGLEIKVPPRGLSPEQEREFERIRKTGVEIEICIETEHGAAFARARAILCEFFNLTHPE